MAWITRLLGGKAILWVIGSLGIVAFVGAVLTGAVNVGIALRSAKVEKAINERIREVRDTNFKVDRKTIDSDTALSHRLQEINQTWSDKQQQPLQ